MERSVLKISVIYTEKQWSMMIKNFNPQINSERLKLQSISQGQTLKYQEVEKGCWIFSLTLTSIFADSQNETPLFTRKFSPQLTKTVWTQNVLDSVKSVYERYNPLPCNSTEKFSFSSRHSSFEFHKLLAPQILKNCCL